MLTGISPKQKRVPAGDPNTNNLIFQVYGNDDNSGNLTVIDFEHLEIHEGDHFNVCGFASLGVGENIDFWVRTEASSVQTHMTFEINGTGRTEMYIFEASSWEVDAGSNGTEVIPINNNRISANTSVNCLRQDAALTNTGDQIFSFSVGANNRGGIISRERERVLKPNELYLFRIISQAASNVIGFCGEWYEHTPVRF